MYSQEREFTIVHEIGHAVCAERFPLVPPPLRPLQAPPLEGFSSRIIVIEFGYDETEKRFDGKIACHSGDLSHEQLLFKLFGGKVAELMARTEGNWDVTAIQTRILSGEFDDTQDMKDAYTLLANLDPDDQNNRRELLAETISQVFSFLKEHWGLVNQFASDLLRIYVPETPKTRLQYEQLSTETKDQLMLLRDSWSNQTNTHGV